VDGHLTSLPDQLSARLKTLNKSMAPGMPPSRQRVSRLAASLPFLKTNGCFTVLNSIDQSVVEMSDSICSTQSREAIVRGVLDGSTIGQKVDQWKGKEIVQTAGDAEWQTAGIDGAKTSVQQQAEIGGGLSGVGLASIGERPTEKTDVHGKVRCMISYPPIPSTAPHVSIVQEHMKSQAAAAQMLAAKGGNRLFSRYENQSYEKIIENVDILNRRRLVMTKNLEELVHTKPWIRDRIVCKPINPLHEGEMTSNLTRKKMGGISSGNLLNFSRVESSVTSVPKTTTVSNHSECMTTAATPCIITAMASTATPCIAAVAPCSSDSGPAVPMIKKRKQSRIAANFSLLPHLSLDEPLRSRTGSK